MLKDVPTYDGFIKLTQEGGHSGKITIRAPFMRELGWRKGDTLFCRVIDGALVVRSAEQLLEEASTKLAERDRDAVAVTSPSPSPA